MTDEPKGLEPNVHNCGCLTCTFYQVLGEGGLGIVAADIETVHYEDGTRSVEIGVKFLDNETRVAVTLPVNPDDTVSMANLNAFAQLVQALPQMVREAFEGDDDDK